MALSQIAEIRKLKLVEASARLGKKLLAQLGQLESKNWTLKARGIGLMAGIELRHRDGSSAGAGAMAIIKAMLHRGFILLPEGAHGNVIGFTPPLIITEAQLRAATSTLGEQLA